VNFHVCAGVYHHTATPTLLWWICQFASIQKEVKSNPKTAKLFLNVQPLRRLLWKKIRNPRWQPRNGCDGRLIAKILRTTIQVNLVPNPSEAWIVIIKFCYKLTITWLPWISYLFSQRLHTFLQLGCFWIRFKLTNIRNLKLHWLFSCIIVYSGLRCHKSLGYSDVSSENLQAT